MDALGDGWEEDRLQRLASGSDCGQAMGRKESASLPLHLQPQLLQDFRRKGSASLPTFWGYPDARESLLSRSGSMPGKAFLLAVMCGASTSQTGPSPWLGSATSALGTHAGVMVVCHLAESFALEGHLQL